MKAEELRAHFEQAGLRVPNANTPTVMSNGEWLVHARGTPARWEALLTLPRKEAMALAALEAGLVARPVYDPVRGAFRCDAPDAEEGYLWVVVGWGETPKEALIAGAEALGLKPWKGRD